MEERQAKDGTFYQKTGEDEWTPVTRTSKDGTVYKKVGADSWTPANDKQPAPQEERSWYSVKPENLGKGFVAGLQKIDEYTGAPVRKFVTETLTGQKLDKAPTGAEQAKMLGLPTMSYGDRFGLPQWVPGRNISPADIYGVGLDAVQDPLVMGSGLAKAGTKAIKSAAVSVGEGLSDTAERFAARSIGAERGTIKKLGQEKVQDAGRYALDNKIITPTASTDQMIAQNEALKAKAAEKMNQVYSAIDKEGASTFNPLDVASKIDEKIGDFYRSPINKSETTQLENTLQSVLMRGDKNIPLSEAQKLKEELGKVANWKNKLNITDKERMAREAYGVVNDEINRATEEGAKILNKDGLKETLQEGKSLYSKAKIAEELLENKAAREQGNKLIGLTDWGLLGASAPHAIMTGGASIPATIGIYGAKKGLEKYGAKTAATVLDKTGNALAKSPSTIEAIAKSPIAQETTTAHFLNDSLSPSLATQTAQNDKPLKGQDKWASDGFEKLIKHTDDQTIKQQLKDSKETLLSDPKIKNLLISASDLSPGSKSMQNVFSKIQTVIKSNKRGPANENGVK